MLTVAITAVALGVGLGVMLKRAPMSVANVCALLGTSLLLLHAFWLNGNPALARFVRSPDAIVWANFSPFFAALLIVSAWRAMPIRWQRWFVLCAVSVICIRQAYGPIFGSPPATMRARVYRGVHKQTTLSTCSAAAAATLLGTAGISTNETEMADLCLTREAGTLQLGLYRGLRLKAKDRDVEFLNRDFDAVVTSSQPVIVSLGASGFAGHSVVIIGRDVYGQLDIADPMTGERYPMSLEEFRRLWTGEAMRIVTIQ